MTGILFLFNGKPSPGARDAESFVNPAMLSVEIDIKGMPNKLYSKSMQTTDFYDSIMKRMGTLSGEFGDCIVKPLTFYAGNMFGLWIDLRTFPDEEIHGGGFNLNDTKNGLKLVISRKAGGSRKVTCYIYVVSDAIMEVMDGGLDSIKY